MKNEEKLPKLQSHSPLADDSKRGVEAIQYLQRMADILESEETSQRNWNAMSRENREKTIAFHEIFKPGD